MINKCVIQSEERYCSKCCNEWQMIIKSTTIRCKSTFSEKNKKKWRELALTEQNGGSQRNKR